MNKDDKIALVGTNEIAKTTLFKILTGEMEPDSGNLNGELLHLKAYFPNDNSKFFEDSDLNLVDWLRQYSPEDETESFLRGFLGRMLFSGEEVLKKASVLSGGEKVRCMLSKMMLKRCKCIIIR